MDVNCFGDDEVNNFLESMEDNNVDDQVNFDFHDYLNVENFLTDLKERYELRSKKEKNVIIQRDLDRIQRDLDRFWPVVLKQNFDLSQQNLKICFAGEAGADAGASRISDVSYEAYTSSTKFGGAEALCFKPSPSNIVITDYFKLGQIVGLSVIYIGRGPQCFHEAVVNSIYGITLDKEPPLVDVMELRSKIEDIDNGKFDDLFEHNINPYVADISEANRLFIRSYTILSRYAAIEQFSCGLASIDSSLTDRSTYKLRIFDA